MGRSWRYVVGLARHVKACHGLAERRPVAGREPARLLPLGKIRYAINSLPHQFEEDFPREARRERMNRLQHREVVAGLRGYDVVRVRHLQRLAIPLDAPGDVADAADRELPLNKSP